MHWMPNPFLYKITTNVSLVFYEIQKPETHKQRPINTAFTVHLVRTVYVTVGPETDQR